MTTTVVDPVAPSGELVAARPPAPPDPLVLIGRAIDKGMSPADLKELFELQRQHTRDVAAERFASAITAFQAECPVIQKRRASGGKGDFAYRFANYEDVNAVAGPILARHRIVVTFGTDHVGDKQLKITCRVRVGVHVEETPFTVPIPADMRVNDTQKFGAALKYAQRYALCAALNIVTADEDNDADKLFENVTEVELAELRALAAERNVNVAAFMKVLKIASDDLADVPRERFAHAVSLMKQKPVTRKPEEGVK